MSRIAKSLISINNAVNIEYIANTLKVSGANFPTSSRCPGLSIWNIPSVLVDLIKSKVAWSSKAIASISIGAPSIRSISESV